MILTFGFTRERVLYQSGVLMPFRAFDDSDSPIGDGNSNGRRTVLMPFRAFDDSDLLPLVPGLPRGHVLMPFRAFDDSDCRHLDN